MSSNQRKGTRRERELVNKLSNRGFAVLRAPASGASTSKDLPDAVVSNGDDIYAIEVKSSSGDPIYIDINEVNSLLNYAAKFGAKARLGIKFDNKSWTFFHPSELVLTDGYSFKIDTPDLADAEGIYDLM